MKKLLQGTVKALAAIVFMTLGLVAFLALGAVDLIFGTGYVKRMSQAGKKNDTPE